jgi:hypothetical protein
MEEAGRQINEHYSTYSVGRKFSPRRHRRRIAGQVEKKSLVLDARFVCIFHVIHSIFTF